MRTRVSVHALADTLKRWIDWVVISSVARSDDYCKARTLNLGNQSVFLTICTANKLLSYMA